MSKTLSTRQFAVLKRTAMNTYPLLARKERMENQIAEMTKELAVIDAQIQGAETGSRALTGGFNSLELIERIVVPSGKVDKDGREIKMTKFVAKADALVQNEDKTYSIILTKDETPVAPENGGAVETTTPENEETEEVENEEA